MFCTAPYIPGHRCHCCKRPWAGHQLAGNASFTAVASALEKCTKSLQSMMHVPQSQPSKRHPSPDLDVGETQFDDLQPWRCFAGQKVCSLPHLLSESPSCLPFPHGKSWHTPADTSPDAQSPWNLLCMCPKTSPARDCHLQTSSKERSLEVSVQAPESIDTSAWETKTNLMVHCPKDILPVKRYVLSHLLSDSSSFLLFYSINWSAKLPLPMHQCCPRYPWAAHVVQHTSHLCVRLRLIWSPTTLKMFCHWSQGMSSLPSSVR